MAKYCIDWLALVLLLAITGQLVSQVVVKRITWCSGEKDYMVKPASLQHFSNMSTNKFKYSRETLLHIGKEVLNRHKTARIEIDTYRLLQQLDISSKLPTFRGTKGGKKTNFKKAHSICDQPQMNSTPLTQFCLVNARSVSNYDNHWDEIVSYVDDHQIDALALTETWLSPHTLPDYIPDGYSFAHVPRQNKRGGGVGLLHRNNLKTQVKSSFAATTFELMEILISVSSVHVRLFILYRPPPSEDNKFTKSQFYEEFENFLNANTTSTGRLLIVGDFNFHWDNEQCNDTKTMKAMLASYNLTQHIHDPTHKHGHTLDWIISRDDDNIIENSSVSSRLSDHHAILFQLNVKKPPLPRKMVTFRSYRNVDTDKFQSDIQSSDLLQNPATTLDQLCELYDKTLSDINDKHAPLKTKNMTIRPFTPWYTNEINEAKKLRRKYEEKWRQTKLTVHEEIYLEQKKVVTDLIKQAKTNFYTQKVLECGKDQKALFRVIDSLQGRNKGCILPSFDTPTDAAEEFSEFFFRKISDIRDKLDNNDIDDPYIPHAKTVLPLEVRVPPSNLQCFRVMTVTEISKIISGSPPKSCLLDPIPTWLLKSNIDVLAPVITDIVNRSLQLGYVPAGMKKALVTPLLKKPSLDKEILKNYRPVSNLSFVSKIIEKAAMSQVSGYSVFHNLLTKFQSAYRTLHSTETALLRVQNDILTSLDAGKGVILCLLDLSAAFDTIDHEIFLNRMSTRMGIQGTVLDWFKSYLDDRHQSVHVSGVSSSPRQLIFGLPQGSHIGPQGFSHYTDEVPEIAAKHGVSVHMYADDTQLYLPFSLATHDAQVAAVHVMEDCINDIRMWMSFNKLKLNDEKTELLIVVPSRQTHKCSIDSINIGGCEVRKSDSVRNLGVQFDSTMLMKPQINSLVKSCNFQLRAIGKIREYLSSDAASNLIHAFVSSRLDYGNSLIFGLPDTEIQRLQKVQHTAARILTRTRKYDHISSILRDLHWLPIRDRIDFKVLMLAYKCLNGLAPSYLAELLTLYIPGRPTRSADNYDLVVPRTRRGYGDRSFAHAAPTLWNELPMSIKVSPTLEIFKTLLKTHLFSK